MRRPQIWMASVLLALCLPGGAGAVSSPDEILALGLEELLQLDVYSASRKEERLADSAAAVFVITAEDIRRSGARTLPDLLRMAPGVQVAQINASAFAVSVRGFNSAFSNKLLVMIDGRTLYTPDFSGVYWDSLSPPVEDIARIEVVRGPGGALWGANAVNGVINILTKSASETQGGLAVAGKGLGEEGYAMLRYGGRLGESARFRVSLQGERRGDLSPQLPDVLPVTDPWRSREAGFRIDGDGPGGATFMLQGGMRDARVGEDQWDLFVAHIDQRNRHVLGRWDQPLADGGHWRLQAYYDHKARSDRSLMDLVNRTLDIDFQHQFSSGRHDLLWGLGYRRVEMDTPYTTFYNFLPQRRVVPLFNLFAQDDIRLGDDFKLTLGTKFEHHDYTGWQLQPTVRLHWSPRPGLAWWGAVSQAVRTPSRYEHDSYVERPAYPEEAVLYAPFDFRAIRRASPNLDAETVTAWEIGSRVQFSDALSLDGAVFFNRYDHLVMLEEELLFDPVAGYTYLTEMGNRMSGDAYGLELAANWVVNPHWRLSGAYTWTRLNMRTPPGTPTSFDESIETRTPRHQVSLRSQLNLGNDWQFDLWLRHASALPELELGDLQSYRAPAYTTLDLRLAWQPAKDLELSLTGRNLLDHERIEFAAEPMTLYFRNRIERSVFAQVRWEF